MNTVFKKCGSKFVASKVQQLWKRTYEEHKLFKNASRRYAYIGYDCASFGHITCTYKPVLISLPIFWGYQGNRLLNAAKNRCWKCHAVVIERDLVCMSCGSVQEPKVNLNHFEIFKETLQFDLDAGNLTVKFRRLQTLLHPDKFASRSEIEQKYSSEQSARVNKAYQTLLRPMERGLYLLELHGQPLLEGEIQLPSDFLDDIMEVNEVLESCKTAETLEPIRHVNTAKLQLLFADVSLSFKEKNIKKARELLCKLKYHVNLDQKIRKLEDDLGVTRDD